jgi:hypothetical protein
MQAEFKIYHCGKNKSFFHLIDDLWHTPRSRRVAHRICTIMRKMGAETLVVEEINASDSESERITIEKEAIKRRLGLHVCFIVQKLTFLDEVCNDKSGLTKAIENGRVLGNVILINVIIDKVAIHSYVFESVTRELGYRHKGSLPSGWNPLNGHYLHVKREFLCSLLSEPYKIEGSFFAQQNGITSVCAHACLVSMLNNAHDSLRIITSEDINTLLKINHTTVKIKVMIPGLSAYNPDKVRMGLDGKDVKTVVEHYGYDFHFRNCEGVSKPTFREFIYGFIESGHPTLLAFQTGSNPHVVAAIGHTLNSNSWLPLALKAYAINGQCNITQPVVSTSQPVVQPVEKRYLSSLAWVDDFLVHDDNVGMQLSLPAHAFHDVDHYVENSNFLPKGAVGIYPKSYNILTLAQDAERAVENFLTRLVKNKVKYLTGSDNYYVKHLLPHFDVKKRTVVLRTSLVPAEAYLQHLKLGDNFENFLKDETIQAIRGLLAQKLYWLVEVSEPDLYVGNKAKVIDILVDPSFPSPLPKQNLPIWCMGAIRAIKFPDLFAAREADTSSFDCLKLQTQAHCTLFGLDPKDNPALIW